MELKMAEEKIFLDNETTELILLRQLITDKKYLTFVSNDFDKRWFRNDDFGRMAASCVKYFKKYDKAPGAKVARVLVGSLVKMGKMDKPMPELNAIVDKCLSKDMDIDQDLVGDNLSHYIKVRSAWCTVADNVDQMESNVDGVVERLVSGFERISKISLAEKDLGMQYFDPGDMEKHWEYILNPEAKIPTGWVNLDKYINGGILKKGRAMYVFMGQAGLGKSLFLSNITVNLLKQGLSIPVISLEMSQDVYGQRFDAHISGQNINKLNRDSETAIGKIKEFYKEHPEAKLFIKEYPPRSIRTTDIEIYLDNLLEAGHKIDAIVIDYLNLVLPQRQTDSMYAGIQEVSERLRALSYKYNAPVITATQTNRAGMNNENIGMENVSESTGIAHTCDLLLGLFQMPEDRENGWIKARVLKNRGGGQVGKVLTFELNPENLILTDISDQNVMQVSEEVSSQNVFDSLPDMSRDIQHTKGRVRPSISNDFDIDGDL